MKSEKKFKQQKNPPKGQGTWQNGIWVPNDDNKKILSDLQKYQKACEANRNKMECRRLAMQYRTKANKKFSEASRWQQEEDMYLQ